MNRIAKLCCALCVPLAVWGCDAGTDKTDAGGVILQVSEFDGLPLTVSVNSQSSLQVEEIELENIPKNPSAPTSDLMHVNILSYEIRFTRGDTGTRLPPIFVRPLGGQVPVGGTADYGNLLIMDSEQLDNIPLADLLFENGGFDTETGDDEILLNCSWRFFGRTLSGDEVESVPFNFDIRATR